MLCPVLIFRMAVPGVMVVAKQGWKKIERIERERVVPSYRPTGAFVLSSTVRLTLLSLVLACYAYLRIRLYCHGPGTGSFVRAGTECWIYLYQAESEGSGKPRRKLTSILSMLDAADAA